MFQRSGQFEDYFKDFIERKVKKYSLQSKTQDRFDLEIIFWGMSHIWQLVNNFCFLVSIFYSLSKSLIWARGLRDLFISLTLILSRETRPMLSEIIQISHKPRARTNFWNLTKFPSRWQIINLSKITSLNFLNFFVRNLDRWIRETCS